MTRWSLELGSGYCSSSLDHTGTTKGGGYGSSFGFEASTILNKIEVLGLAGAGKHGKWHRNGLKSASESGLTIKPCGPPALTLHFQFPPTVPFLYVLAPGAEYGQWVAKPGLPFGEDLPSSWLDLLGDFGQCGCAGQGLTEGPHPVTVDMAKIDNLSMEIGRIPTDLLSQIR